MFNRLYNVHNPYQGTEKRVLAVCSAGLLRSPTTAWVLGNDPFNFNTRACGVHDYALIRIDEALVEWADEIIFVEPYLLDSAIGYLPDREKDLREKAVLLNVPDKYPRRNPELVKIILEQYENR